MSEGLSIPFDKLPTDLYIRGPRYRIGDRHALPADDEPNPDNLLSQNDINQYRDQQGAVYVPPAHRGHSIIDVLPQLWGLPLCDLTLAYVHACRPSLIRVVRDWETTDSRPWRITIYVDNDDRVKKITQEVEVGYGCGSDVGRILQKLREDACAEGS